MMIDVHWYQMHGTGAPTTHGIRTMSRERFMESIKGKRIIYTEGLMGPAIGWYDSANAKGYYAYIDFKESY